MYNKKRVKYLFVLIYFVHYLKKKLYKNKVYEGKAENEQMSNNINKIQ